MLAWNSAKKKITTHVVLEALRTSPSKGALTEDDRQRRDSSCDKGKKDRIMK